MYNYNLYLSRTVSSDLGGLDPVEAGSVRGFLWCLQFERTAEGYIQLHCPTLIVRTVTDFGRKPMPGWWRELGKGPQTTIGLASQARGYSFDFSGLVPLETLGWQYPLYVERYYVFQGDSGAPAEQSYDWCAVARHRTGDVHDMHHWGAQAGINAHHTLIFEDRNGTHELPLYATVERFGERPGAIAGAGALTAQGNFPLEWALGWVAPVQSDSMMGSLISFGATDINQARKYPGCSMERSVVHDDEEIGHHHKRVEFLGALAGQEPAQGVAVWADGDCLGMPLSLSYLEKLLGNGRGIATSLTESVMEFIARERVLGHASVGLSDGAVPGNGPLEAVYVRKLATTHDNAGFVRNPPYF